MFQGCSALIQSPELPAPTTKTAVYMRMFNDCSSLIIPPSNLPATKMSTDCYRGMFSKCNSLSSSPIISATDVAGRCFQYMF